MRHGAQRRFTRPAGGSRVDELSEALSYLEEGHPLLGHVHGRARLRVASLAGVAVADAEAAEAAKLDLVTLRERVGDVVEDRVDDRLGLFLRQIRELGDFVNQIGFGHRPPRVSRATPVLPPEGTLARG